MISLIPVLFPRALLSLSPWLLGETMCPTSGYRQEGYFSGHFLIINFFLLSLFLPG